MKSPRHSAVAIVVCLLVPLAGCRGSASDREAPNPQTATPPAGPSAPDGNASARPRIVALGDSLTAGLGLPSNQAYPALLQKKLEANGYAFEVVNAGVSGDTSAGGLRRLDWALEGDVRALILALGANDGLRGLPTAEMKNNLEQIITRAKARNIAVILAGMEAPPNYGAEYTSAFRAVYRSLAQEHQLVFMPFLLVNVAGNPSLNQGDGIHPNAQGAAMIAHALWKVLRPVLDQVSAAS